MFRDSRGGSRDSDAELESGGIVFTVPARIPVKLLQKWVYFSNHKRH